MSHHPRPAKAQFSISADDATWLDALLVLPLRSRVELIKRRALEQGNDWLVSLFAHVLGLCNSVEMSVREHVDLIGLVDLNMHPHGQPLNIASVSGALTGARIAIEPPVPGMCGGCAFRLGTPANQSPITAVDAGWAVTEGRGFFCHETTAETGECSRPCMGYRHARKQFLQQSTKEAAHA